MDLLNTCAACYEAILPECCEQLVLAVGLAANTQYAFEVTDKFDHTRWNSATTNADGQLVIDMNIFPEGLFNRYAGKFTIEVRAYLQNYYPPLMLTIGGNDYECIIISFEKSEEFNEGDVEWESQTNFIIK